MAVCEGCSYFYIVADCGREKCGARVFVSRVIKIVWSRDTCPCSPSSSLSPHVFVLVKLHLTSLAWYESSSFEPQDVAICVSYGFALNVSGILQF